MKKTKQGVRDLGGNSSRPKKVVLPPKGNCPHTEMKDHCKDRAGRGCGHYVCAQCGLFWDDGAWG